LRERIVNDCPIQCKKAQCEAEWRDASETHHTQGLTTTPEQAGSDGTFTCILSPRFTFKYFTDENGENYFLVIKKVNKILTFISKKII
jgi:hypothetical protein